MNLLIGKAKQSAIPRPMIKRKLYILLIVSLALQGCSIMEANTADDIRSADGAQESFMVPLDFDTVVRNEFYISDTCPPPELNVGGFISRHYLDHAKRTATINYGVDGPAFGYHIWQVIDVIDKGSETEVHTYVGKTLFNKSPEFAHNAREWALGSKSC